MLIVDDLLAAPMNGLIWVFKEIQQQATDEQRRCRERIDAAPRDHRVAAVRIQMTKDSHRKPASLEEFDHLHLQGQEKHEGALNGREAVATAAAGTKPGSALKTIPAVEAVDGPATVIPEPVGPEQPQTENPS